MGEWEESGYFGMTWRTDEPYFTLSGETLRSFSSPNRLPAAAAAARDEM